MNQNEFLSKLNTIKRNEYDLQFLIHFICQRPLMFVGNKDIKTIAAFIDGFAFSNELFFVELKDFTQWISCKFDSPKNIAWWNVLEKIYPNSEDALKSLPKLFEEFKKNQIFDL